VYGLIDYCAMIADTVRMDAYRRALERAVTRESVVLDIGTGIGVFAVLARQYGARRVYAVEPGDVIRLARRIAEDSGATEGIEFLQEMSTRITLPERADVMISDLRAVLPLFQHHIPSIVDARKRLLAPGAVLIPQRDTLWAAVVNAPATYRKLIRPWSDDLGVDMQATEPILTQMSRRVVAAPDQLVTEPRCWATLDYETIASPNVHGRVEWTVAKASTAHGLLLWFDTQLAEGIGFSNAPGAAETIYGNEFFPFTSVVDLEAGDSIEVDLAADLVMDRYVWRWSTRVTGGGGAPLKASFRQTYLGTEMYSSERRRGAGP
jgi:protein arginine N-methyltransferase 1